MRAVVMSDYFPWDRSKVLNPAPPELDDSDNLQLVHGFYLKNRQAEFKSNYFSILNPLLRQLKPAELIKAKVNKTFRMETSFVYGLHVDTKRSQSLTAVFYLNNNNGGTLFEGGRRISSQENTLLVFDSSLLHSGVSCTDTDGRYVININMIPGPGGLELFEEDLVTDDH
jgi:2OG-Fe(II) oxygenase superfamily